MPPSSSSSSATSRPPASSSSSSHLLQLASTKQPRSSTPNHASADAHALALATSKASKSLTTAGGRSLDRQVILEEEAYSTSLSRIIKRDFFPELARLDATNEYLLAVEAMDEGRLEASVRRLWEIEGETGATPRFPIGHDPTSTPLPFPSTPSHHRPSRPIPSSASTIARASHLPSLDAFQTHYTSEDNASFTSLLASENVERKKTVEWAYAKEAEVRDKVKEGEEKWRRLLEGVPRSRVERERMVDEARVRERARISGPAASEVKGKAKEILPPPSPPAPASSASSSAITIRDVGPNASDSLALSLPSSSSSRPLSPPLPPTDLPLPPNSHLALALRSAGLPETRTDEGAVAVRVAREGERAAREEREKGKAGVEAWPWKARNSLMFAPDIDVSPHLPPSHSLASTTTPAGPPREIRHDATRLPDGFAYTVGERVEGSRAEGGSSTGGRSPTRSEVGAAIAGTPYHRPQTSSSTPGGPSTNSAYPYVAPLPSPTPSMLGPARISQLLTWGTLLSTPRALPSSEGGAGGGVGGWTIKNPSKRDTLGRALAGKAAKSLSDRAKLELGGSSSTAGYKRRKLAGGGGLMLPPSTTTPSTAGRRPTLASMSPAARGLSERLKTSSAATGSTLTPRATLAGGRRGEAMERVAGWAGSAAIGVHHGPDLGRRRWSESPSPRVSRARE